ncbi:MAG: hypothetical protein IPK79_03830 [Vampirovibrionales bacterium]|nr:hypothetical protein [Vampirovibrionales bacterium]
MYLIARKSDLELETQFISQHRLYLANQVSGLFSQQAQLDPDSKASKVLEARIKQLQVADKMLEMHLNRVTTQHQAIGQEIESVRKVISENIKGSFGLMGR